jgi:hypothetical protein
VKYAVVYTDENMIDSPLFDTEEEAKNWMTEMSEYLESNGESLDSFQIEGFTNKEIAEIEAYSEAHPQ